MALSPSLVLKRVAESPAPYALPAKTVKLEIQKLSDIDHALHAGDFYIGQSVHQLNAPVSRFVYDPETDLMKYEEKVQYPHGLVKIFDEALVNAADNRHRGTTTIKVGINRIQNTVWVHNDGPNFAIVPTEHASRWNPSKPAYQPEVAFFHCKTSSAYGKKKRVTGGKFGLGAKLIAIYSHQCSVEMCDGKTYYFQKTTNHMKTVYPPKVKPATKAQQDKPFLSLCFTPDLSLFYPEGEAPNRLPDLMMRLFQTRVWDIAGTVPTSVKVHWGVTVDTLIHPKKSKFSRVPVKGFKQYVKLFLTPELKQQINQPDGPNLKIGYQQTERWEVCAIQNPHPLPVTVSFVNNINTYLGGEHVKYLQSQLLRYCREKVPGVDSRRVQQAVMLFVNATIEDPSFNNQSKEALITTDKDFGSSCQLSDKFLRVLNRNGVMESLKSSMNDKELAVVRKNIGAGRRKPVHDIPKLRDAEYAGTRQSSKCTLIVVEGISALQLAEVGLSVLGTEYYGAFPLRGKCINADASLQSLSKNKEFVNLCRILGLEIGKDTPLSQLRYGHVITMCDQDHDGSHITGLFVYFFRKFWPHLLRCETFMRKMITPIIVASKKIKGKLVRRSFFHKNSYDQWRDSLSETLLRTWNVKYYKGLGTSSNQEGKLYFQGLRHHLRDFHRARESDFAALDLAFNQSNAAQRKDWINETEKLGTLDYEAIRSLTYEEFVHKDYKHYALATLKRNLPLAEDGLTPSSRKCLWTMMQKDMTEKEYKVHDLQSVVSTYTKYHHNSDSLGNTLITMAQAFVGKPNLNFLVPGGQFGTRSDGGKTHSAPRYIFSKLNPLTRAVFPEADDPVLQTQEEEGQTIEPVALCPVICLALANGADGTSVGYRANVPCYRPEDLIAETRRRLSRQEWRPLQPWYHKFRGEIRGDAQGNYTSTGLIERVNDSEYRILELPVKLWREKYKEFLSRLVEKQKIESFVEKHEAEGDMNGVCFVVQVKPGQVVGSDLTEKKDIDIRMREFFHLSKSFSSNLNLMVLRPENKTQVKRCEEASTRIRTFNTVEEIFNHWFEYRMKVYALRRSHALDFWRQQQPFLQAKIDFIKKAIDGTWPWGQPRSVLKAAMTQAHLSETYHDKLLKMTLGSLTGERVSELENELKKCMDHIAYYSTVTLDVLFLHDLDVLEKVLPEFWKFRDNPEAVWLSAKKTKVT